MLLVHKGAKTYSLWLNSKAELDCGHFWSENLYAGLKSKIEKYISKGEEANK
jgi:hypothetical protein